MKSCRIYTMQRLHRDAWRIVVLDTHCNTGGESHNYDARIAMRKAIDRLILTALHLGQPNGYEPHRRLTRQELKRCKRNRRLMKKAATVTEVADRSNQTLADVAYVF